MQPGERATELAMWPRLADDAQFLPPLQRGLPGNGYSHDDHARDCPMSRAPAIWLTSFALVAALSGTACAEGSPTKKGPNSTRELADITATVVAQ